MVPLKKYWLAKLIEGTGIIIFRKMSLSLIRRIDMCVFWRAVARKYWRLRPAKLCSYWLLLPSKFWSYWRLLSSKFWSYWRELLAQFWSYWRFCTAQFWSLTSSPSQILVILTSSGRQLLRGFQLLKLIWSWKMLQLNFLHHFPCSGGPDLWYIDFFPTTVGSL